jgi:hypothetical protein
MERFTHVVNEGYYDAKVIGKRGEVRSVREEMGSIEMHV